MQQVIKPVASWYEATAQRHAYDSLRGDISADVCVIGGGFAGLVTALECQRRGLSTVVLEAQCVGWGASGRNGGFVSNGFALGVSAIMRKVGKEAAQQLYALSREGTEHVRRMIAAHEPSIIMGHGTREVLRHPDDGGLRSYIEMMNRDFGETFHYSSTEETRLHLRTARYFESRVADDSFHIHPLNHALMLARVAAAAGARIYEASPAQHTAKVGSQFLTRTDAGTVRSQHVVHCVSALAPKLHPPTGRAMLPVATYVAVTNANTKDCIRSQAGISDTRRANDYYRLIPEGRVLWGGRITTQISEPVRLADLMRRDMVSVYPDLAELRMEYAWAGLMGYAVHKMPLIGRDSEGQWYATAFGGHGINTAAMGGLLVARGLAGEDDAWRRFTPFAPQWAFGQLGRLGVQGSYWWMQARDRWEEAKAARK